MSTILQGPEISFSPKFELQVARKNCLVWQRLKKNLFLGITKGDFEGGPKDIPAPLHKMFWGPRETPSKNRAGGGGGGAPLHWNDFTKFVCMIGPIKLTLM